MENECKYLAWLCRGWRTLERRRMWGGTRYTGGYTSVYCRLGAEYFLPCFSWISTVCQCKQPQLYSAGLTRTELKAREKNISINSWVTVGRRTWSFSFASSSPWHFKMSSACPRCSIISHLVCKQARESYLFTAYKEPQYHWRFSNEKQSWSNGTTVGQEP